jgi:hypothetical protein
MNWYKVAKKNIVSSALLQYISEHFTPQFACKILPSIRKEHKLPKNLFHLKRTEDGFWDVVTNDGDRIGVHEPTEFYAVRRATELLTWILSTYCLSREDKKEYQEMIGKEASKLPDVLSDEDLWGTYYKVATMKTLPFDKAKEQGLVNSEGNVETMEGDQEADENDLICIGVMDEAWPQKAKRVETKYEKIGVKGDYTIWKPKYSEVEAVEIVEEGSFEVNGMKGKCGDFVLRDKEKKEDKWVVDGDIFMKSYKEKNSG